MSGSSTNQRRSPRATNPYLGRTASVRPRQRTHRLAEFVETLGADTVFIDSLKTSPGRSHQTRSALHGTARREESSPPASALRQPSQPKATAQNRKPTTLADVYGSTWITSGAGSVISLWGEPGDPLVELTHLKQPADDVGPLDLEHDHTTATHDAANARTPGPSSKARCCTVSAPMTRRRRLHHQAHPRPGREGQTPPRALRRQWTGHNHEGAAENRSRAIPAGRDRRQREAA